MDEKLMSVDETAKYLNISKQTLYGWICRKKLPHIRFSAKFVRFSKSDIDVWLKSKSQPAKEREVAPSLSYKTPLKQSRRTGDRLFDEVMSEVL